MKKKKKDYRFVICTNVYANRQIVYLEAFIASDVVESIIDHKLEISFLSCARIDPIFNVLRASM